MKKALFTTLTAAIMGASAVLAAPAQAQTYMMPERPMEAYSPVYDGPMEIDTMATGSVLVPQTGPAPGQTWIGYCRSKFPTYNQTSNTYTGPDGGQYLCH
jgi:hypothetical protein